VGKEVFEVMTSSCLEASKGASKIIRPNLKSRQRSKRWGHKHLNAIQASINLTLISCGWHGHGYKILVTVMHRLEEDLVTIDESYTFISLQFVNVLLNFIFEDKFTFYLSFFFSF